MAIVLALAAAVGYGLSDFVGGVVSRRTSAWPVAVVVQLVSALAAAVLALMRTGSPTPTDLWWAALAGIGSGVGVGFLFRGLARGRMSVVAPLSAVGSALVPVTVGVATGERPGMWVVVGILVAFPGIWLVASGEDTPVPDLEHPSDAPARASGLLDGALAGLGFGAMFAALGQVPEAAGLWPVAATQAVSTVTVALLATALGASWLPRATTVWRAAPAGVIGALAVVAFQVSTTYGLLSVTSVLTALYPAATILLAMAVLHERVHRAQAVGLLLCGVTVALVAAG